MPLTPTNRFAAICAALGHVPIQPSIIPRILGFSSYIERTRRRCAAGHREQAEAESFDGNDVTDVGFVEQVATPHAELEVPARGSPAESPIDERALAVGQALDVAGVIVDLRAIGRIDLRRQVPAECGPFITCGGRETAARRIRQPLNPAIK